MNIQRAISEEICLHRRHAAFSIGRKSTAIKISLNEGIGSFRIEPVVVKGWVARPRLHQDLDFVRSTFRIPELEQFGLHPLTPYHIL
jgi:hypothetical protein